MSTRVKRDADLKFVNELIQAGGGDLKKCFQCSTCTVSCPLTPEGAPFPRKEMIYAQWGMKDKLTKSMDPWLCFHCNDCSDMCPREAKPGDVMAAIRNMVIANVSVPSIIGKATQTLGGTLILLLIPIVLLAAVILGINGGLGFLSNDGAIDFHHGAYSMISQFTIEMIYLPAALFAVITGALGIKNLINGLKETYPKQSNGQNLIPAIISTLGEIASHSKFRECGPNKQRNVAHMLLIYGFIGLVITTAGVTTIYYVNKFAGPVLTPTPLPFFHPIKIIGNVSAVAVGVGILIILFRRLFSEKVGKSTAFDYLFILNIVLLVATGVLTQATRVAGSSIAYIIYYSHLVFVFFLFAYAPHSKFGHMFYRTAALVYAKYSGRSDSVYVSQLGTTGKEQLPNETEAA